MEHVTKVRNAKVTVCVPYMLNAAAKDIVLALLVAIMVMKYKHGPSSWLALVSTFSSFASAFATVKSANEIGSLQLPSAISRTPQTQPQKKTSSWSSSRTTALLREKPSLARLCLPSL